MRHLALILCFAALAPPPAHAIEGAPPGRAQAAPIDINHAALDELKRLPGINDSLARRIVDNRPYRNVAELTQRAGLDEVELMRIKPLIVVTPPATPPGGVNPPAPEGGTTPPMTPPR